MRQLFVVSTCRHLFVNQMPAVKTRASSEGHFFIKESAAAFEIYSLNKKKSVLLITAHGSATADSAPRLPPGRGVGAAGFEHVPAGIIPRTYDDHRTSTLRPAMRRFAPNVALTYFNEHNTSLISEEHSTLRLILQARAIGLETYSPGREQADYGLGDVTQHGQVFAGVKLPRKDFIKAGLLEAEFLRESEHAQRILLGQSVANPFKVMVSVPDVLMVSSTIALSEVLAHPLVASQYTRVFCSFCRSLFDADGLRLASSQHVTRKEGLSRFPAEAAEVEARVLRNLREIGIRGV